MSLILKVPTHLDGRNPIVGRYTARDLVPVVAGVFGAAGVLGQPHLLPAARVGEALAVTLLGGTIGLVRPSDRSLVAWGRLAATHLLGERTSTWTLPSTPLSTTPAGAPLRPPHLTFATGTGAGTSTPPPPASPASSGGAPRPVRRPASSGHPFVPAEIAAGVIIFADGRRCAVLECSGATVEGMDVEQQRALHVAYHAFLLGLSFPVQILVCADPVDLGPYAARRTARLSGRPLAVRRLGSADAAYMRRALAQVDALDQRVYVVIPDAFGPTPSVLEGTGPRALRRARRRWAAAGRARDQMAAQDGDATSRLLAERCAAIREGLARAGIHAWRLDTAALQHVYYRRLCPRTARLQPFDRGHAAPVATARVLFDQVAPNADDESEEDDDETDDADDA